MNTLLFCAKGFETIEFSAFIDVLGWARNDYGYPVDVETCGFTKQVMSTFNIPITVDKRKRQFMTQSPLSSKRVSLIFHGRSCFQSSSVQA